MSLSARISVRRGEFRLRVDLHVAAGAVVVLLGPNGAGKSTTLATLAGLIRLDEGRIELDGTTVADAANDVHARPQNRSVGVVWQDYLLFPHMSVVENVAFGRRARGIHRRQARDEAHAWLDRLGLTEMADRRPRELSGGQAQRVALARSLIVQPKLLLLDEPLAALDAGTRPAVRADLRRHLAGYPGCTVLVTHDPLEALVLGDRVVVLENGRVTQQGGPAELTRHPRTDYVAQLVGLNLINAVADETTARVADDTEVILAHPASGEIHLAFSPSAVTLSLERPHGSARNVWPGVVTDVEVHGDLVRIAVDGPVPFVADVTRLAVADLGLAPGVAVWGAVKASEISAYPRDRLART